MRNVKILATGLLLLMLASTSCKKQEIPPVEQQTPQIQQKEGLIVLGKQLEDPYAIKNMKKAYSKLKSENADVPDIEIKPNRIYLRFLPKNEKEWGILKSDTSLVLFDYPLNYEIVNLGTYYHDPSLSDSTITWQYCVVPMDYEIPPVEHEILYEAFIPPVEDSTSLKSANELQNFYGRLEDESNKLTGNAPKDQTSHTKGWFSAQWRLKGTIRVWDDVLNLYIPLAQAEVHARYFIHVETALTNDDGYFETNKFRCGVNYAIKWERSLYDIRDGMFSQAWFNGPNLKHDWNLDIASGKSLRYATIHRAAYKHFYGDNLGIWRPRLMTGGSTKICYMDSEGTGVFWGDWSASGILPDIKVWGKDEKGYKPTQEVFGTTTHELGHQAHSQYMGNVKYWQVSEIVYESWADAVEWALSNDEYHKLGIKYGNPAAKKYDHIYNSKLSWPFNGNKSYSPIFIDLMDIENQRTNNGSSFPNDMISGYTLSYINFNILKNSFGIGSLRTEVKNHKITGVTDAQIDELFALY